MASKSSDEEYSVAIIGPGHKFDRKISEDVANRIISFVMSGAGGGLGNRDGSGTAVNAGTGGAAPAGNLAPKQFMAQKKPANNYERVACLAYYLTHHRETASFKTDDIKKINTESAHHFTNAARVVDHATSTYHYLSAAGGGKKQITTLGEALVEALPEREKVKAAVDEHGPVRKSKKRKKKKTKK